MTCVFVTLLMKCAIREHNPFLQDSEKPFFFFLFFKLQLIRNVPISAVQQSDPFPFSYYLPSWSIPRNWVWFPVLLQQDLNTYPF